MSVKSTAIMSLFSLWVVQWSVQEPLTPGWRRDIVQKATGSPVTYISSILHLYLVCTIIIIIRRIIIIIIHYFAHKQSRDYCFLYRYSHRCARDRASCARRTSWYATLKLAVGQLACSMSLAFIVVCFSCFRSP